MFDDMTQLNDEQLKSIIDQAGKLLDERDRERKAQAAKQIKEMAAKAGLRIEIKGARKRRGRPRKSAKDQSPEKPS